MDDEKPGEDPRTAGEFILYVILEPRGKEKDPHLVFEPSAW